MSAMELQGFGARAPLEDFGAWYRTPDRVAQPDPRYVERRAHPSEFDAIYDLVDDAFGAKRPRRLYDWLYRDNPRGPARCWVVVENGGGRLLSSSASFPWPLADGSERIDGCLMGDLVTARDWQRRRIHELRVASPHDAWWQAACVIGWPNEKSRGRTLKAGQGDSLLGELPRRVYSLHRLRRLRRRGGPTFLAAAWKGALDASRATRRRFVRGRAAGRRTPELRIQEICHFDAAIDPAAWHGLRAERFWSPRDAAFLNWRYLDHPTRTYVAWGLLEDDALLGHGVLQLDGSRAVLMELSAPPGAAAAAGALLERAIEIASEADCRQLEFFATPSWPHWELLRRVGFAVASSEIHLLASSMRRGPEVQRLENWQLVPGDQDSL
jgi:hypothetical protein